MNFNPKFLHDIIVFSQSCYTTSRRLKVLSIVHSAYSKISLKTAL